MKLKSLVLLLFLQLMIFGCSKEENENYHTPEISTSVVSEISFTTAICGGDLTSDGGKIITAKGLVWHILANATIDVNTGITIEVNELGLFVSNLIDLIPDVKYFVRAYATNEMGTAYGEEKTFITSPLPAATEGMIVVEGGTYQMGSNNEFDTHAKPIHSVTLSSFEIGKYEVTQAKWENVMGSNPSYFKGDNLPVENVSWNDVQTFISKLNEQTGLKYRLPTEAEWEFAARGGVSANSTTYAGSNTFDDVAWYFDNSGKKTHEVGTKQANELGIYDMSGNVWERCNDWYGSYGSNTAKNPQGPTTGFSRVLRGGGWNYDYRSCYVAERLSSGPRGRDLGFRLARSL